MKKIFMAIVLCLVCTFSFGQEHLTFKNVEIDGDMLVFCQKMETCGFTTVQQYDDEGIVQMKGTFMGYRDCSLFVIGTQKSKKVWKVIVDIPEVENDFYTLKSQYENAVEAYTKKYGKPDSDFYFFRRPYYEGDGYEMQALRLEKLIATSFWHINNGTIVVKITKYQNLQIGYEDKKNCEIHSQEKQENINNDI